MTTSHDSPPLPGQITVEDAIAETGIDLGTPAAVDARRTRLGDRQLVDALADFYGTPGEVNGADLTDMVGELLRAAGRVDGSGHLIPQPTVEPRSYVIGLPVVIDVYPDGAVRATVDLSEAYEAPFESSGRGMGVGEPDDEDLLIADREAIEAAVDADAVQVS